MFNTKFLGRLLTNYFTFNILHGKCKILKQVCVGIRYLDVTQ